MFQAASLQLLLLYFYEIKYYVCKMYEMYDNKYLECYIYVIYICYINVNINVNIKFSSFHFIIS